MTFRLLECNWSTRAPHTFWRGVIILLPLALTLPSDAAGQRRCSKGIPCGNTCIAADKVCRVVQADQLPVAPIPLSATPQAPAGRLSDDSIAKLNNARERSERLRARAAAFQDSLFRAEVMATAWPASVKRAVLNREVTIGMTSEQARLAWGRPEEVNTTITEGRRREQWVYGLSYLYLEKGRVVSIQHHRRLPQ